ncbi:DUF58 domain-containing protein [bacterium]|nr:DUF58 domain-containing protein [bacterium]
MKKRHYKWYSATYRLNEKIERKFTTSGKVLLICAFSLIFFGLNTRVSMLFVVFAASLALILTDAVSLMFKSFAFEFERFLPDCVAKGKEVKYPVILRAKDEKAVLENLFYAEVPAAPVPTFEVFAATKEPGEEKRNAFDRRMGYYRWKWLIDKNCGGKYEESAVAGRKTDGGILFEASFLPERRGKITFGGAYIFHKGVFGLLKKGKIIANPGSFLVLPEIKESFEIPENEGADSNEKNEKTRETPETGSGFELKSLRDFVPGDSIRNIHWKSSAKSGQLRTKEFYKEVDSGSVMFVDNFFEEHFSEDFEKILSAAASLLNAMQIEENLPQLLFVGREIHEIPDSSKKSFSNALSTLALAENDAENKFENCLETLFEAGRSASTVFFFTSKYDENRKKALKTLAGLNCGIRIFYAGSAESDAELSRYETKIDFQ